MLGTEMITRQCIKNESSSKFIIKETSYNQQFSHIYFSRLKKTFKQLKQRAQSRWSDYELVPKLIDVQPNQTCIVIGTIYVDMPLKPNVLYELGNKGGLPPPPEKLISDNDQILLEDESGRLSLTGDLLSSVAMVTGITVAILGRELLGDNKEGFEVLDISFPQLSVQRPLSSRTDGWIAICSGLEVCGVDMRLQLLADFLNGELGLNQDQSFNGKIVGFMVAGNSTLKPVEAFFDERGKMQDAVDFTVPIGSLDSYLFEIATSVPVTIMPGANDPANFSFPQQPMQRGIFTKCKNIANFECATNPYLADLDGIDLLATSGQNIDDLYKFVTSNDRLDIMEKTLVWGHIAPTAPDTLWCYPFKDDDPFVLEHKPHVYIVGNQPEYATRIAQDEDGNKTRLIAVPSFNKSSSIVLMRTTDLECQLVSFKI